MWSVSKFAFIFSIFVAGIFLFPSIVACAEAAGDIEGNPDYMGTWDRMMQSFNNRFYGKEKVPFDVNSMWKMETNLGSYNMSVLVELDPKDVYKIERDFGHDAVPELVYSLENGNSIYSIDIETDQVIGSFFYGLKYSLGMTTTETLATADYVETLSLNHVLSITDKDSLVGRTEEGISTQALREHYGLDKIEYTGKDVKIAVLDTGVYINNSYNSYNVSRTFVNTTILDDDGIDRLGHGSHVISTINGNLVDIGGTEMHGLAYDSTVYSIKVLNDKGSGTEADIIKGLELAMSYDVDIISMSLGGYMPPFTPFYDTIEEAVSRGIIVICAAGNDGTKGPYPAAPAAWDGVISVGALDIDGYLAFFTNLNYDVATVGKDVTAPAYYEGTYGRVTLSGTSMATPVFSALVACFLEAHPGYKGRPSDVQDVFLKTGDYRNPDNSKKYLMFSWDILGYNDYYYSDFPEADVVAAIDSENSVYPSSGRPMTFSSIQFWRTLGVSP